MKSKKMSPKSPKLNEYWKIKNGKTVFSYALIVNENPLSVQYFEDSVKGLGHRLNEDIWQVFDQDLDQKVCPPEIKNVGKFRKFYHFM